MFRFYRNWLALFMLRIHKEIFEDKRKVRNAMGTETKLGKRNKGGRPPKAIKRNKLLGVKCTLVEKITIQAKAKYSGLSVSEYLRGLGMNGKIDMQKIMFPKEILQFTSTLNHLAANMNQAAKKRNYNEELNALERANLSHVSVMVKQLVQDIKNRLK
ncbi:MAG: mobilization protein [Sediminibacterium sp.]|nr:mobilization protein [Sediminibacterium sp.]